MTVHQALQWGIERLKKAGVSTPDLDAEVLLDQVLSSPSPQSSPIKGEEDKEQVPSPLEGEGRVRGHAWLYAHPEYKLSSPNAKRYTLAIRRRARREPVAHIVGHKEFYGLDFLVNRNVLIPRPETETLVEEALKQITRYTLHGTRYMIVDVGTGSGCLSVSIIKQLTNIKYPISNIQFFATDISHEALNVARANARRHGVADRITFLRGNLLDPLLKRNVILSAAKDLSRMRDRTFVRDSSTPLRSARNDKGVGLIITANLPYLPTAEWRAAQPEVRIWEPRQALDGGKDGLKYYRELLMQLKFLISNIQFPVSIFCEICPEQAGVFKKMVRVYFPHAKCGVIKDLAWLERVIVVQIK